LLEEYKNDDFRVVGLDMDSSMIKAGEENFK